MSEITTDTSALIDLLLTDAVLAPHGSIERYALIRAAGNLAASTDPIGEQIGADAQANNLERRAELLATAVAATPRDSRMALALRAITAGQKRLAYEIAEASARQNGGAV